MRRIVECILGDERSILTVSSYLDGEYGIRDVCLSVPSILGSEGIDRVLEVPFALEEVDALRRSADTLKALIQDLV